MSERLTGRNEEGTYLKLQGCAKGEKQYFTDDREFMNAFYAKQVINKLAEFEDFMEENNFKNLTDLKKALGKEFEIRDNPRRTNIEINGVTFNRDQLFILGQYDVFKTDYLTENQALKSRWEELKEYVNIPLEFQQWDEEYEITVERIKNKMQELEKESEDV